MPNDKRSKVAFIHPDLGIGGAERLIIDLANALSDEFDVVFLVNHFDPSHCFDELKDDRYEIHVLGSWIPRSIFGKCRALLAYIKMVYLALVYLLFYVEEYEANFHIVDLIPVAIPILKWFNEDVIYYCHHPDLLATTRETMSKKLYRWPIDWVEYKATKSSDLTLVNSKYTAEVFERTFPEIKKKPVVLYPTISSSVTKLLQSIDSTITKENVLNVPNDSVVFLSINRFHPAKKLELAIQAMSQLRLNVPDSLWQNIYLVMVGGYDPCSDINKEYFEKLEVLTRSLKVNSNVIFMKSPSEAKKVHLLHASDCLIYTPVNEHFGIVPVEAMMAKKPVIACNSGGPKETISNSESGYLCEPTPDDMAHYMLKLINNQNFIEMGQKGYLKASAHFSNAAFKDHIKDIIAKASAQ